MSARHTGHRSNWTFWIDLAGALVIFVSGGLVLLGNVVTGWPRLICAAIVVVLALAYGWIRRPDFKLTHYHPTPPGP